MAERHEARLGNEHDELIDDFIRQLDLFDTAGDQAAYDAFAEVCARVSATFALDPDELNEFIEHTRSQRELVEQ